MTAKTPLNIISVPTITCYKLHKIWIFLRDFDSITTETRTLNTAVPIKEKLQNLALMHTKVRSERI